MPPLAAPLPVATVEWFDHWSNVCGVDLQAADKDVWDEDVQLMFLFEDPLGML